MKTFLNLVIYVCGMVGLAYYGSMILMNQNNISSNQVILQKAIREIPKEKIGKELQEIRKDRFYLNSMEVIGGEYVCVEDETIEMLDGEVIFGRKNGDELKLYML